MTFTGILVRATNIQASNNGDYALFKVCQYKAVVSRLVWLGRTLLVFLLLLYKSGCS